MIYKEKIQPTSGKVMIHQWYPGRKLPGVVNDHDPLESSKRLCGCFIIGGPDEPHIHASDRSLNGWKLREGNRIVYREDGTREVITTEEFESKYQPIDQILF